MLREGERQIEGCERGRLSATLSYSSFCFFVFLRVSFPLSMQSVDRSFCGSSFTICVSTSSSVSLSCIYLVRECLFHKLSFLFLFLSIHIFITNGAYHHQCHVLISRALMCFKWYHVFLWCFHTHRCCMYLLSIVDYLHLTFFSTISTLASYISASLQFLS